MDLNDYSDVIEEVHNDADGLENLRVQIAADDTLSDYDKSFLDGRIGTYLADLERADPVDLLEPEGGDGASTE